MSAETSQNDRKLTYAFFIVALVIVAALAVGFLTLGVAGIGLVMVGATPVALILLVFMSAGG